jgi:hypothetical protein
LPYFLNYQDGTWEQGDKMGGVSKKENIISYAFIGFLFALSILDRFLDIPTVVGISVFVFVVVIYFMYILSSRDNRRK